MKVSASGMLCEASYELRCAPRCVFQVGRGTGAILRFFFSGDRNTIRKPGPFPQPDFSPPGKPTFSGRFFGSIRSGLRIRYESCCSVPTTSFCPSNPYQTRKFLPTKSSIQPFFSTFTISSYCRLSCPGVQSTPESYLMNHNT